MADYNTAESNLKRRFGENRNGLSYDEWLDKAKSFYKIDGPFVVSIARSKNKEDIVNTGGPWQAQKRVITLIATKYRDHFDRGYDFAWDPVKRRRDDICIFIFLTFFS